MKKFLIALILFLVILNVNASAKQLKYSYTMNNKHYNVQKLEETVDDTDIDDKDIIDDTTVEDETPNDDNPNTNTSNIFTITISFLVSIILIIVLIKRMLSLSKTK